MRSIMAQLFLRYLEMESLAPFCRLSPKLLSGVMQLKHAFYERGLRFLVQFTLIIRHYFHFFRISSTSIKITFLMVEFLNWYIKGRMQNSEACVYLNTYMYASIYFSDVEYSSHNSLESWDRILVRIKENPCLLRGCYDDTSWFNYHLKFDRNVIAGWNLLCQ